MSSPLILIVLLFLFIVLARANFGLYKKVFKSSNRLDMAQFELDKTNERSKDLSKRLQALSTNEGIEAEIRTKFHAVKAGESVAVIIDEENTASIDNSIKNNSIISEDSNTKKTSFWHKFLSLIGIKK